MTKKEKKNALKKTTKNKKHFFIFLFIYLFYLFI